MKIKKAICIVVVFLLMVALSQQEARAQNFGVGLQVRGHLPTDPLYKNLYGSGSPAFGGFFSALLKPWLELIAEANFFQDKGAMSLTQEDITLTIQQYGGGLRINFLNTKLVRAYTGLQVGSFSVKEDVPERLEDFSESSMGFILEGGAYLKLSSKFHFYLKLDVEERNLGGPRLGVGLKFRF
jgi:hypothetical protein